jgi:hypothetical protein
MSGSTWSWVGRTTAWADSTNWNFNSGADRTAGFPQPGDTILLSSAAVQPPVIKGAILNANTIELSGSGRHTDHRGWLVGNIAAGGTAGEFMPSTAIKAWCRIRRRRRWNRRRRAGRSREVLKEDFSFDEN